MSAAKKVVILGGGVAGMSCAHELVERGFQVEVLERKLIPGGKARSLSSGGVSWGSPPFGTIERPSTDTRRPPLPGEHGFRFFPGFYKHIVHTMDRIPYQGGSVAQNLVDATELRVAPFDRPSFFMPARFPRTGEDLKLDVFAIIAGLSGKLDIPLQEGAFFATKMWQFLTSCEERRLVEYERTNWWDFIEAEARSAPYKRYFGNGITRSLVAAKARRASSKTIGNIFMQIVFDILLPGVSADRLLNGPTNDVWIDPWLAYLQARGVTYHRNAVVTELRCERGRIRSAVVSQGNSLREVAGDYFIGALPVERMAELLTPQLLASDPSLANLHALTDYVEWMNGIQFYLRKPAPLAHGHVIYVDSPWALTSVSQEQFWKAFPLERYGDGTVQGLLSVDISDWDVAGLNGKQARHCSREEIAQETWEQLKRSLNTSGTVLTDADLHSWFLDPDIDDLDADFDPATPRLDANLEPLLVNYVDTWRIRPEAVTRIPNFFLASDYVRTFTDLATMEAANEAARRAVNGVLRASRSQTDPCQVWNLHEPEVFVPFRAYDRTRYRKGQSWDGEGLRWLKPALDLGVSGKAEKTAGAGSSPADATHPPPGLAAAIARSSSDHGLRRLRLVR